MHTECLSDHVLEGVNHFSVSKSGQLTTHPLYPVTLSKLLNPLLWSLYAEVRFYGQKRKDMTCKAHMRNTSVNTVR